MKSPLEHQANRPRRLRKRWLRWLVLAQMAMVGLLIAVVIKAARVRVNPSYYVFDATLGVRFRPLSWAYALEADEAGAPSVATRHKLAIDAYGMVANVNTTETGRDYGVIVSDPDILRVVVSGGSTAAGWGASDNEHTWPARLESLLNEEQGALGGEYRRAVVINAGVFGYNIAQEFKRFTEETLYLRPHVLISLNGMNERWSHQGNPVDFATKDDQYRMTDRLNFGRGYGAPVLRPFASHRPDGTSRAEPPDSHTVYGYRAPDYIELGAVDLYLSKTRQMRAVCEAEGIALIHVLQPIMGVGGRRLTAREESLKQFMGSEYYREPWDEYRERAEVFYTGARDGMGEEWQHDLSGLFDGVDETVYSDPRHYNDEGNELIARWMFDAVLSAVAQQDSDG